MKQYYYKKGEELAKILGFEAKLVIMYWTAFEALNFSVCKRILDRFENICKMEKRG